MMDIAVVGAGAWGGNLVRTFQRLGALKSVCDLNPSLLNKIQAEFPKVQTTQDLKNILDDPDIKGVAVATPPIYHFQVAKNIINANKNVFIEKPLALNLEDGEKLVALAKEKNVQLMVGHLLLYHPATQMLKDYIDSGELGSLYYVYSNRLNLGKIRREENVLWSLAPHDISVICYLLKEKPIEVSCTGMPYVQPNIEDVAFCTLRFESGILAHLHVSWLDPHKVRKVTLVGSKKMVIFDDMESSEKIKIFDKGALVDNNYTSFGEAVSLRFGDIVTPFIKIEEPLLKECNHFLDCVRSGTKPLTDGEEGLEVLRILRAADISMKGKGKWVCL